MSHNTEQQEPVITPEQRERAMRLLTGLGFDSEKFFSKVILKTFNQTDTEIIWLDLIHVSCKVNIRDVYELKLSSSTDEQKAFLSGVLHALNFFYENIKP